MNRIVAALKGRRHRHRLDEPTRPIHLWRRGFSPAPIAALADRLHRHPHDERTRRSTIVVSTGTGDRAVALDDVVSGDIAERAEADANVWIKRLRHARVDGQTFRDRFTLRGDSLWWFAELYLHKRRIVTRAIRALHALEQLAAERPASWTVDGRDRVLSHIAHLVAERRGFPCRGPRDHRPRTGRLEREIKAVFHTATALADRLRPARAPRTDRPVVAAFVHSAFANRRRRTRPMWALCCRRCRIG